MKPKAAVFTVSRHGIETSYKIADALCDSCGYEKQDITIFIKCDRAIIKDINVSSAETCDTQTVCLNENDKLNECVGRVFPEVSTVIFVCAAGIAVRSIAPYIRHKSQDPAVLVIDEMGKYCIPILSGHLGGANRLAVRLSDLLGTKPVITTASDINNMTAADIFAMENSLVITDYQKARELTASLLEGNSLYVLNEAEEVTGRIDLPKGYESSDGNMCDERMIRIKYRKADPESKALVMAPRCLKLGIGCRSGVSGERIEAAVNECFNRYGLYVEALEGIYSIDLKKDEEGILSFCKDHGLRFTTYSAEELKEVSGDYASSDFVKDITGVDNVCERSVMVSGGKLIVRKEPYGGITLAVALKSEGG